MEMQCSEKSLADRYAEHGMGHVLEVSGELVSIFQRERQGIFICFLVGCRALEDVLGQLLDRKVDFLKLFGLRQVSGSVLFSHSLELTQSRAAMIARLSSESQRL
jgi:hypothetical protein